MSNHGFMFLDSDFNDISKFCMRMEKNIVEGDGVDAVIWAGKIAERVTHYICNYVNLNLGELDQNKKLAILLNKELIPEEIYDQLDSIRQYRNIATHHDLNNEIQTALKTHKMIFNILIWFYGVYKADESIFRLKYPGVTYRHDENFIKKLKSGSPLGIENSQKISLSQIDVDYNVHRLFNQSNVYFNEDLGKYTAFLMDGDKEITIGHFKSKEVAVRKGYHFVLSDDFKVYKNFHLTPEKMENGKYSDRKGIDFDEEEGLWTASFNNKDLGYFISENSAIIARKEYIDTLPIPQAKNGSYSDYKEITFDLNHKLWCILQDGEVYDYYDSEEEAIYNLTQVMGSDIGLEKLGIVKDEKDQIWRVYYKNKYVARCYSEREAINKRLEYVSSFAQPKRNRNGDFSIHKGIFYDEKNLIWTLRIKGELMGFFDTEEEAFKFKRDFLKSKGLDVSNLIFQKEDSIDEDFDFKVKINSDENAIVYNEDSDEWIAYFRGNEIGRCKTEQDAQRLRISHLKSMPYPPRKENGKYSLFEGIDYDINRHLWTSAYEDEAIGFFDSEEDAFYALKDHLVKEGHDVSGMHFKTAAKDDSHSEISDDSSAEIFNSSEDASVEGNKRQFVSYYDLFRHDDESDEDQSDSNVQLEEDSSDDLEVSLKDIEKYKKTAFYGMAEKAYSNDISEDISIYEFENDDDENEFINDLEMANADSEVSDRFSQQKKGLDFSHKDFRPGDHLNSSFNDGNLWRNSNRNPSYDPREFKEIRFNFYDFNGYRREIVLAYNFEELFISLESMISDDELKRILSDDYFSSTDELNYKREGDGLYSVFINLRYDLDSIGLKALLSTFDDFGWNFDLLNHFSSNCGLNLESIEDDGQNFISGLDIHSDKSNALKDDGIPSRPKDYLNLSQTEIASNKENSDTLKSKAQSSDLNDGSASLKGKSSSSIAKDGGSASLKGKSSSSIAKDDASNSFKGKKSKSKKQKAIIRGGVRVSLEEAEILDNAKEEKEIKSTIIRKKPEKVKEFRTTTLGNIFELNRANKEKEKIDEEDSFEVEDSFLVVDSESLSEEDSIGLEGSFSVVDSESLSEEDSIGLEGSFSVVDSESLSEEDSIEEALEDLDDDLDESIDDALDDLDDDMNDYPDDYGDVSLIGGSDSSEDSADAFDYGDISVGEGSNLSFDDIFDDDEDDLSFEDGLELLNQGSVLSDLDDSDSDVSEFENEEAIEDELATDSKPKKIKKPKKKKKEKIISPDAFDDKYKNAYEIEHDEENDKWVAYIGGELFKSFDTPKEAVIERKKALRRKVPIPRKGLNGKYSDEEGIDFNFREKIWTVTRNGIIVGFAINEKDAVIKGKVFDFILDKLEIDNDDLDEEKYQEIRNMDLDIIFEDLAEDELAGIGLSQKEASKGLKNL